VFIENPIAGNMLDFLGTLGRDAGGSESVVPIRARS
jgi:hypothetical protein